MATMFPMTLDEARVIGRSVREESYPPTNQAVLLRAAYTLYLDGKEKEDRVFMGDILIWARSVFATNEPESVRPEDR